MTECCEEETSVADKYITNTGRIYSSKPQNTVEEQEGLINRGKIRESFEKFIRPKIVGIIIKHMNETKRT